MAKEEVMGDETAAIAFLNELDKKFPGNHEYFLEAVTKLESKLDKEKIMETVRKVLKFIQKTIASVESIDNSKSMHMAMAYFILAFQRLVKVEVDEADELGKVMIEAIEEHFAPPPRRKPDEPTLFTPQAQPIPEVE